MHLYAKDQISSYKACSIDPWKVQHSSQLAFSSIGLMFKYDALIGHKLSSL